jgi:hypothetical protein
MFQFFNHIRLRNLKELWSNTVSCKNNAEYCLLPYGTFVLFWVLFELSLMLL